MKLEEDKTTDRLGVGCIGTSGDGARKSRNGVNDRYLTCAGPWPLYLQTVRMAMIGTNRAGTEAHVQPRAVAHAGYVTPSYWMGLEKTMPTTSTVWR